MELLAFSERHGRKALGADGLIALSHSVVERRAHSVRIGNQALQAKAHIPMRTWIWRRRLMGMLAGRPATFSQRPDEVQGGLPEVVRERGVAQISSGLFHSGVISGDKNLWMVSNLFSPPSHSPRNRNAWM